MGGANADSRDLSQKADAWRNTALKADKLRTYGGYTGGAAKATNTRRTSNGQGLDAWPKPTTQGKYKADK